MNVTQTLTNHCREMASRTLTPLGRKLKIYDSFVLLEQADLNDEPREALSHEISQIIETAVSVGLVDVPEFQQTVEAIIQAGTPDALSALSALRTAVAEAHPSRKAIRLLLRDFGQWLKSASVSSRENFLEVLPQVATCIEELGPEGVKQMISVGNSISDSQDQERFFRCVHSYGATAGNIVLAICQIAPAVLKYDSWDYLDKFEQAISPEKIMESADAEKLITAIAQLSEASSRKGKNCWVQSMDLILKLAEANFSSAYFAARKLAMKLPTLEDELAHLYVRDFHCLAHSVGIRAVGFATDKLPHFYRRFGTEPTHKFVETTALVAKRYGITAGQWFFEQRTAASRAVLAK